MTHKTKELFSLRWTNIGHHFWQSETIQDRTYFMIDVKPLAYQDYKTCNHIISSDWLNAHTMTKMKMSKWIGLSSPEIREMIKTNQYKLLPHNKFLEELIEIGKTRWKGVRTK
jgi:hypothetical protein